MQYLRLKLTYTLISLVLVSCNSHNQNEKKIVEENQKDTISSIGQNLQAKENKQKLDKVATLYFEQKFGPNPNQKASYKLDFQGDNVKITYVYAGNEPIIESGKFKNGKIVIGDCLDCYVISSNRLCVNNPETGEPDCYLFIYAKSTATIDEILSRTSKNTLKLNLPFTGTKYFNFWGGNGTGQSITIKKDATTIIKFYGTKDGRPDEEGKIQYKGMYSNPIKVSKDKIYKIEGNKIYLINSKGVVCEECVTELH